MPAGLEAFLYALLGHIVLSILLSLFESLFWKSKNFKKSIFYLCSGGLWVGTSFIIVAFIICVLTGFVARSRSAFNLVIYAYFPYDRRIVYSQDSAENEDENLYCIFIEQIVFLPFIVLNLIHNFILDAIVMYVCCMDPSFSKVEIIRSISNGKVEFDAKI
jgi:uncharacterized membrane protein YccF (DUF307 family)